MVLLCKFKYIIYIGECENGYCATDKFFDTIQKITESINIYIPLLNFHWINDECTVYKSKFSVRESGIDFRSKYLSKKIFNFVVNHQGNDNKAMKKLVMKTFGVKLAKKHINFLRTLVN